MDTLNQSQQSATKHKGYGIHDIILMTNPTACPYIWIYKFKFFFNIEKIITSLIIKWLHQIIGGREMSPIHIKNRELLSSDAV